MDLIRQFNKYAGENKSLLQKALTSSSGSGEALIPQHLEQVITNAIPRLSPCLAMVTPQFDNQKYHEFNRLTALPDAGGAMGESAVTPTTQPQFARTGVYMKVVRRKGATTDFLRDSSKKNIDAAATNIEASMLQHVYDLENYILFGNAGANPYEFSGLDTFIGTNRVNKAVGGAEMSDLSALDDAIDNNMEYQGIAHRKAFVMSPQMLSKVSRLLTNVRLNQGLNGGLTQVDIAGGWRLNAYRDVPIIVSSSCRPKVATSTPVATNAQTGGTITDATTRYIRISAVTYQGEQLASPEVTFASGSSANTNIMIATFTPVAGAYRYKVYVGTSAGTLYLRHVVPAFAYDANGTPVASTTYIVDTGKTSVASNSAGAVNVITFLADPNVAGSMVATGLQLDVPLTGTVGTAVPENIFLWDLDEFQGIGRLAYTNEGGSRFNGLVTIEDLAKTDDYLPFMIKSYCALADSFEKTCSVLRGFKVA